MTRGAAGGSGEAGMFPGPPVARQLSMLSPCFWGVGGTPACQTDPIVPVSSPWLPQAGLGGSGGAQTAELCPQTLLPQLRLTPLGCG